MIQQELNVNTLSTWCWRFPEKLMLNKDGKTKNLETTSDLTSADLIVVHEDTGEGDDALQASYVATLAMKIRFMELAFLEGDELIRAIVCEQVKTRVRQHCVGKNSFSI